MNKGKISLDWVPLIISLSAMCAAVGSSIAAIINSITAKNNLNESIENNKRALKPFLIIRSKEVELSYNDNPPHLLNWDTNTFDLGDFSKSVSYLELANINNGIAKNVSVNMNFKNELSIIKILESLNNPDPYLFINVIKDNKLHPEKGQTLLLEYQMGISNNNSYGNDEFDFDRLGEKKFLAVEKGGNYKIEIPPAFMLLYNVYFQFPANIPSEKLPKLEIAIELNDIVGNEYKHEYIFSPQSYNIQTKSSNRSRKTTVNIIFDVEEK
jgi:hypothetical protein